MDETRITDIQNALLPLIGWHQDYDPQHQIDENSFAEAGLAPAGYAYSNVTNGAGALAGVLMYETDWLEL